MEQKDGYISPVEAVDSIEEFGGRFPSYRRAHAKGIAFDAEFVPNGSAKVYTIAPHLQDEKVAAVVRLSHSTVTPDPPEWLMPIKGMAVQFWLPNEEFTNLTMANVPVFITKTPEAFIRLLKMMTGGAMSWRERWRVLRKDPEFRTVPALLRRLRPVASFATETYNALHSYYLVDKFGERRAVRFRWEPVFDDVRNDIPMNNREDLEVELIDRVDAGRVQFRLMIQFAGEGDPIDDPTVEWPDDRPTIDAGILTLTSLREDGADAMVFDPTIEVEGLKCSEDPILRYRSPVYDESASRRFREVKLPGQ